MSYSLREDRLGYKINDVLMGLKDGTRDTPQALLSSEGKLHTLLYTWNPDSQAYEAVVSSGGAGLDVRVTNLEELIELQRGMLSLLEAAFEDGLSGRL